MVQLLSVVVSDTEFIRLCDHTRRPLGAAQISAHMEGIRKGLGAIDATRGVNTVSRLTIWTRAANNFLCIELIRYLNKSYMLNVVMNFNKSSIKCH